MITLATAYFGPILHYALIAQNETYQIEQKEHFVKQSFRSRCETSSANGKLKLIVPLQKWQNNCPIQDIEVSYQEDWQKLHWRSLESAYRLSPFFEYYEDELRPFFEIKYNNLLDLNWQVEQQIKKILQLNIHSTYTETYETKEIDLRQLISPKNKLIKEADFYEKYIQVFEDKYGFIPNLSILDLLFNLGPAAKGYLEKIDLKQIINRWQKK